MSLNRAVATYGLTEEQIADAKLDCQWRSTYGNSYPVLKCEDLRTLKAKLDKEEAEKKEQALIDKYGADGLAKMRKNLQEKKEAEAAAAKAKEEREKEKKHVEFHLSELENLGGDANGISYASLDGVRIAKTAAKKEWFLNDSDLANLTSVKDGRSIKYELKDLMRKAGLKHGKQQLSDRLKEKGNKKGLQQFTAHCKDQIESVLNTYPHDLIVEAHGDVVSRLKKQVEESQEKVRATKEELADKEKRLLSFETLADSLPGSKVPPPPLGDSTNAQGSGSAAKKAKLEVDGEVAM